MAPATAARRSTSKAPGRIGRSARTAPDSTSPKAATDRWSCCCMASLSSGGPGGGSCPRSATAGFRAVAVDLRGYGGSDKPPRGYDLVTAASDAAGLVRSLGEANAVVVGHDWGGMIAWTMAAYFPEGRPAARRRLGPASAPAALRRCSPTRSARAGAAATRSASSSPLLPERQLLRERCAARRPHAQHLVRAGLAGPGRPSGPTGQRCACRLLRTRRLSITAGRPVAAAAGRDAVRPRHADPRCRRRPCRSHGSLDTLRPAGRRARLGQACRRALPLAADRRRRSLPA